MNVLIALLVVALIGLSGWLLFALHRLQKQVAALQLRLQTAPPLPMSWPVGKSRIAIEILNPFELAARETRLAGAAAKLAPRMIERIVYERAAVMIAQQMAEQGVQAEVKHHVA
ncbi:MAG: hypothetical protein Q7J29_02425 [Stagnimonas sp.]|nr:hypothetical protein [Stagnimonas sp.]